MNWTKPRRRRKSSASGAVAPNENVRDYLRSLNTKAKSLREQLAETTEKLNALLLLTPTIPWEGAPVGPDESANVVIRTVGTPPEFGFKPLDHVELLEKRGWADFARARKVAGERAYALMSDLVLFERAVHSYALDLLDGKDFTLVSVPSLVREEALIGTGMFPAHREETYAIPADDLYLAGTAEVALVGFHSDEILDHKRLPIRYAGISPCFRREAGSAGRDVRGLLRVHQFEKVEQFVICAADAAESDRWHAELLGTAEQLLQGLGLAYEVMEISTGDMGAGKYRMNDINTWMPSLGAYRETHSCSSLHDWQARRANVRYRDTDGTVRFAYTLNNTAVATPRILAALVENFQTSEARGAGARGAAALPRRPRAALSSPIPGPGHEGAGAQVCAAGANRRTLRCVNLEADRVADLAGRPLSALTRRDVALALLTVPAEEALGSLPGIRRGMLAAGNPLSAVFWTSAEAILHKIDDGVRHGGGRPDVAGSHRDRAERDHRAARLGRDVRAQPARRGDAHPAGQPPRRAARRGRDRPRPAGRGRPGRLPGLHRAAGTVDDLGAARRPGPDGRAAGREGRGVPGRVGRRRRRCAGRDPGPARPGGRPPAAAGGAAPGRCPAAPGHRPAGLAWRAADRVQRAAPGRPAGRRHRAVAAAGRGRGVPAGTRRLGRPRTQR